MKLSEIKIMLLELKSTFFKLSDKEIHRIEELSFQSVDEDDFLIVLKEKWHELSWLFGAAASIIGIIYIIKQILA